MNKNILQSFKSECAPCIKLLSPLKVSIDSKESTLNHWNESFLTMNPKPFHVDVNDDDACSLVGLFRLVWMKIQIHSLPLGAAFGAVKIAVSPVKAVHKAALHSQTLLYQALQARWNENETNRTNHCRLASRKGGVWKINHRAESFESRCPSKVKISAHYKCFLTLHACQPVIWTPKTKIWTFHNP